MRARSLPIRLATLLIGGLVFIFIILPIGAMLLRSFEVSRPAPVAELRDMTLEALKLLNPQKSQAMVERWVSGATPRQKMEAVAAAFELNRLPVTWDRSASFDDKIFASESAMVNLTQEQRARVEADLPIAIVMLHKRIPLAFQVKSRLNEKEFDALRSGTHKTYGLTHYLAVFGEERLRNAAANSLMLALIATTVTTLTAFLIAFGINRGGVMAAGLARLGILMPLVSPPVVIATAAILLFGRNGLITKGVLDNTFRPPDLGRFCYDTSS